MSKSKTGLGRGLDALINPKNINMDWEKAPDYSKIKTDDGKSLDQLAKIPIDKVATNPFQPRTDFNPEALEELKKSILQNGLIQPITVRRLNGNYQLISGERRLKACLGIGYKEIPAYIIKVESDEAMLALALIENIQRENLNAIETANAYKRLMDECQLTQEQIAETVGKNRTTIANSIRLLKLPEEIQASIIKDEISAGHARAIINLPSEKLQLLALKKILNEGLSVRKVEQLAKQITTENSKTTKRSVTKIQTTSSTNLTDIEDKLRKMFGTKVMCKRKKDGTGQFIIEFYSNEEFERIFELFEIINQTYN
ncbi:MAG: DNA-binding protein [Ignavibacteriales bacterium CG12_big_fil_rev_8_21_14_0_65_30_8]|nr:MAG: DNA-binding protein [Ignavibacteriales bacterium CG12_big_fil_rev_8_21_14_0_65_30_8]